MYNALEKTIDANDLDSLIGNIDLIDIRQPNEYANVKIKTSKNIAVDNLLSEPSKYLRKDKKYYIICQCGSRSTIACEKLSQLGYDVVNVKGGVVAYSGQNREY